MSKVYFVAVCFGVRFIQFGFSAVNCVGFAHWHSSLKTFVIIALQKPRLTSRALDLAYAFFLTLVSMLHIFRWRSWLWVRQTSNANRWASAEKIILTYKNL